MATEIQDAPTRAHRRGRALDPYIERLRRLHAEHARRGLSGRPLELEVGGSPVAIEAWILDEGVRVLADESGEESPRAVLLTHTAALSLKVAADRVRLKAHGGSHGQGLYTVQAELMLDSAMGTALLRELQPVIDHEVAAGRLAEAKRWTKLKNEVHAGVSASKTLLAESERKRVDTLADDLTEVPGERPSEKAHYAALMRQIDDEEKERKHRARVRRLAREALSLLPSRTEALVAALAVTAVIWLTCIVLPGRARSAPRLLTATDFPGTPGLAAVEARPPSLYVTVEAAIWSGLSAEERLQLVQSLATVLMTSDYRGLWLRTVEGRPVGQWLRQTGAKLIETDETRSEAPPVEPPADSTEAGSASVSTEEAVGSEVSLEPPPATSPEPSSGPPEGGTD